MGSRTAGNEHARAWSESVGAGAGAGTFADAAGFGELLFSCIRACTRSRRSRRRARQPRRQGADRRRQPARLLARHAAHARGLQHGLARRADPAPLPGRQGREGAEHDELRRDGRPGAVPGEHDVFVCGEDDEAKGEVVELLESFGWPPARIVDLGGIAASRQRDVPAALAPTLGGVGHRRLQHRGAQGVAPAQGTRWTSKRFVPSS